MRFEVMGAGEIRTSRLLTEFIIETHQLKQEVNYSTPLLCAADRLISEYYCCLNLKTYFVNYTVFGCCRPVSPTHLQVASQGELIIVIIKTSGRPWKMRLVNMNYVFQEQLSYLPSFLSKLYCIKWRHIIIKSRKLEMQFQYVSHQE